MSSTTRRRERKTPQQRLPEIRAAAQQIALAEGLNQVTVRGVAHRARIAPGLVSHYVPNMDALRADTFAALVRAELLEIEAETSRAGGVVEALRILIGMLVASDRDCVTGVWLDAWSTGRRVPSMAEAVRQEMDAWQGFLVELIDRGRDSGQIATDDSDAVAWHLIGMADGLNAHSLVHYRDSASRAQLLAGSMEQSMGLHPGTLTPTFARLTDDHDGGNKTLSKPDENF